MIFIPIGILIYFAGLISGIKLTNWLIKRRLAQTLSLKIRETKNKDEMTKKIIEYFKTVTPEQLSIDLEKANYSVLKNVKSYTLAPMYIKQCDFEFAYEPITDVTATKQDIIL